MMKKSEPRQFPEPEECQAVIKRLRDSLVFSMSHGSHELFHTNIWAWLIERDHGFVEVFFPKDKFVGEFESVKREEGDRDLTVWTTLNNSRIAYVVENKFKAAPREEQLQEYEQDLAGKGSFGGGLLVSLQTPPGSDKWHWRVLEQSELMHRLLDRMEQSSCFSLLEKEMVKEYARMTEDLSQVLLKYSNSLGFRWPKAYAEGALEDVRLGDIFKKMKAAELVEFLECKEEIKEIRSIVEKRGLLLVARASYSNKAAIVDVLIMKRGTDDKGKNIEKFFIGIQVQGDQYRRCVCSADEKLCRDMGGLYECFRTGGFWLGDVDFLNRGTRMKKEFCKFSSSFVYQYVTLKNDKFNDISDDIVKDLRTACCALDNAQVKPFLG